MKFRETLEVVVCVVIVDLWVHPHGVVMNLICGIAGATIRAGIVFAIRYFTKKR